MPDPYTWLEPVIRLALSAGEKVMAVYNQHEDAVIDVKQDGSPLTEADRVAHECIVAGLNELTPDLPVLSEESTDIPYSERVEWSRYWLVDPLDGTKEFIARTGDFTVNIALIDEHHTILGVVYAPVLQTCYFACKERGAYKRFSDGTRQAIHTASWQEADVLRIISSRRHGIKDLAPFLAQLQRYEMLEMGSSLKFCMVAEGSADIYPRFGLTSEWDTAAAQCIVEEAGGAIVDHHGLPLQYNTRDSLLNPYFYAIGNRNLIHHLRNLHVNN